MNPLPPPATPDEAVARMRAALAEAGCPRADPEWDPDIGEVVVTLANGVTLATLWKAGLVTGQHNYCWGCTAENDRLTSSGQPPVADCPHDPWTSPGPP